MGHGELVGHIAVDADRHEAADEGIEGLPVGAEDDLGRTVFPRHHDIVCTHPVGDIIAI